jgi:hypothetical protein
VQLLFTQFEAVLGPTGASKALHMLAPRLFPLWDATIAQKGYHLIRRDADDYWLFVNYIREQALALGGESGIGRNYVKSLNEYNYSRFTLGL